VGELLVLDQAVACQRIAGIPARITEDVDASEHLVAAMDKLKRYRSGPALPDGPWTSVKALVRCQELADGRAWLGEDQQGEGRFLLVPDTLDLLQMGESRVADTAEFIPGSIAHYWCSLEPSLRDSGVDRVQLIDLDAVFPATVTFDISVERERAIPTFSRTAPPVASTMGELGQDIWRDLARAVLSALDCSEPEAVEVVIGDLIKLDLAETERGEATWISALPTPSGMRIRRLKLDGETVRRVVVAHQDRMVEALESALPLSNTMRVVFTRWAPWLPATLGASIRVERPRRGNLIAAIAAARAEGLPLYYRYLDPLGFKASHSKEELDVVVLTGQERMKEGERSQRYQGKLGNSVRWRLRERGSVLPILYRGEPYRKRPGGPAVVASFQPDESIPFPIEIEIFFDVRLGYPPDLAFHIAGTDMRIPYRFVEGDERYYAEHPKHISCIEIDALQAIREARRHATLTRFAEGKFAELEKVCKAKVSGNRPVPAHIIKNVAAALRAGQGTSNDVLLGYSPGSTLADRDLTDFLTRLPLLIRIIRDLLQDKITDPESKSFAHYTASRLYGALPGLDPAVDLKIERLMRSENLAPALQMFGRCNTSTEELKSLIDMIFSTGSRINQEQLIWALSRNLLWLADLEALNRSVDIPELLVRLARIGKGFKTSQSDAKSSLFLSIILLLSCAEYRRELAKAESRETAALESLVQAFAEIPVKLNSAGKLGDLKDLLEDMLRNRPLDTALMRSALIEAC
jgi:hypothetical protein